MTRGLLAVVLLGLTLVIVLAWPREAAATGLNVEQIRIRPDDDGLHGNLQLGIDFQAGNTNRLDVSASAALGYRYAKHVAFIVGNSKYSTRTRPSDGEGLSTLFAPGSRFVNKANAHLRYNYEALPWLIPEVFGQLERDEFLLVESRMLFGLGPRLVPFTRADFTLALGTDYMLEYEALAADQIVRPLPAQTLVHRWSSYFSLNYGTDRLRMSSTTYVQPRFDRFRDARILSSATLDVTIFEQLSVRLGLRLRWDSEPSVYCGSAIGIAGCAPADEIQLREVDVAIENALAVRF